MAKLNPSIRDVAEAAGVSVATASRVLAKADYPVAEKTRDKVQEAARRIGFVPNALARSLARAKSDSIGVVVPSLINPYYAAMIEGIDAAARDMGLTMLLALTNGDEARREALIDSFLARQVDGVLICAGADDHVMGRSPAAMGVPTILIGQQPNAGYPIIRTDNRKAGAIAADHLWQLGHRHITYLTSDASWHDFHERGLGMQDFMASTGAPYEAKVVDQLYTEDDAYRHVLNAPTTPTAYLASTDRHALGAMAGLADRGIAVPEQVSVMGFDDYITSSYLRPALTTMRMPSADMGRRGVEALFAAMGGNVVEADMMLPAELVQRRSTGPVSG